MRYPITEHVAKSSRHTTFYLACGPADGTLIVFVHGWPELSLSWQEQLRCFGALGFRAVAPDMRGYGRSSVYRQTSDYALEHAERDMLELLDALARPAAVWVGHDWGAPVVWSIASHHPQRCLGVAALCVPYIPGGFAVENLVELVDRTVYPADTFPAGQWDYQLHYLEHFEQACATFDADPYGTMKALLRRGDPGGRGKPARLATIRRDGGWFGGAARAPDIPHDASLLSLEDLHRFAAGVAANGFFGPNAWYMNGDANRAHAQRSVDGGRLSMPVLFFHGEYDWTCCTVGTKLADPMRTACRDLTEQVVPSGHWMAMERPAEVNAGLAQWLASRLPQAWASHVSC